MGWLFNTSMLGAGGKGSPPNGVSFTQRSPNGVMGKPYNFVSKAGVGNATQYYYRFLLASGASK